MSDNTRLRIAIQKSGRLADDSFALFSGCGMKIRQRNQRLILLAENMPVEILLVRDDDIPGLVMDEVVDLGIVGEGVLEETRLARAQAGMASNYEVLKRLDFGSCRLCIALPEDINYEGPQTLANKRIATSFPQLLKQWMQMQNLPFNTCLLTGSVEIAPRAGLADAICDQVSTGQTLEANGLKAVQTIFESKACLIERRTELEPFKRKLVDTLLARIEGMIEARESKYIMLHAPKEKLEAISELLPGCEHPTLLPMTGDDTKVVMHMVSRETLFWETMEKLKVLGASSILVLPIEKMLK